MKENKNKYDPQMRYAKANVKRYRVDCVITTEQDIIDKLESQENKAGYIKALIRADIEKTSNKNSN